MFELMSRKSRERVDSARDVTKSTTVDTDVFAVVNETIDALLGRRALPDLSAVPQKTAMALEQLNAYLEDLNLKSLKINVDHSIQASDAMAATARTSSEIKLVDQHVHSMSAGIEELTASIRQLSHTANGVAASMEEAHLSMTEGAQATKVAQESSHSIGEYFGHMSASSKELSEAVQQIAGFIGNIDALSQQTNLLALNATIEAARAGEAGRGFSVVASEVKTLSTQTRRVTDDIRSRIQLLEARVAEVLNAVETAGRLAEASAENSQKAEVSISSLSQIIAENAQSMTEIAGVLAQQDGAVAELASGIVSLSHGSKEAAGFAKEATQAVSVCEVTVTTEIERLAALNIKNLVLYRAKADHALWKKQIAEHLAGAKPLRAEGISTHHTCRLGKWYDSVSDSRLTSLPAFKALEEPHKRVHEQGKLAVQLSAGGDMGGAWRAYLEMEKASKAVIRGLDELISQS